ncbi:MAG: MarR family transcriptional regulator [Chloroflexi bacterium]|nr:MarR family transcriptional regulator [Chloroflexota bacterium]
MSTPAALVRSVPAITPETSSEAVAVALVGLLPRLYRVVVSGLHETPGVGEMSVAQFRVLGRLGEQAYRAAELAAALEISRPTLTAIADGLVRRGLVERRRELPGDRRGVLLHLTPAGRAASTAIQQQAVASVRRLLADAQPIDLAALERGIVVLERGLPACDRVAKHAATSAAGTPSAPGLSAAPHGPSASAPLAIRERTAARGAPSATMLDETAARTAPARGRDGGQS